MLQLAPAIVREILLFLFRRFSRRFSYRVLLSRRLGTVSFGLRPHLVPVVFAFVFPPSGL